MIDHIIDFFKEIFRSQKEEYDAWANDILGDLDDGSIKKQ